MENAIEKHALILACNDFKSGQAIPSTRLTIEQRTKYFKTQFETIRLYVSTDKNN